MSNGVYIIDTNIVSVYMRDKVGKVSQHIHQHRNDTLILPEAVIYEVKRGLKHQQAYNRLSLFENQILPMFHHEPTLMTDWELASTIWATMRGQGRQLSDVDVIISAITIRLRGTLVTADNDFMSLPFPRENWLV